MSNKSTCFEHMANLLAGRPPQSSAPDDRALLAVGVLITLGADSGKYAAICAEGLVIGRGEACGLQLTDGCASRFHCRVWAEPGRIWVRDLGSLNGTLVRGRAVETMEIECGDELTVGLSVLSVMPLDAIRRVVPLLACFAAESAPAPAGPAGH